MVTTVRQCCGSEEENERDNLNRVKTPPIHLQIAADIGSSEMTAKDF